MTSLTKNYNLKLPNFKKSKLQDSASLEGLISSLAQSVSKLWLDNIFVT